MLRRVIDGNDSGIPDQGELQHPPGTGGTRGQRQGREHEPDTDALAVRTAASPPPSLVPTAATVPVALPALPNVSGAQSDNELVELWLRGKHSHHTRLYYRRHAEDLLQHLNERGRTLRFLTLADAQDFADARPGSDSSRATAINAIKSLLSFGHKTGYLPVNVGAAVQVPKAPRNVAERILEETDVQRMLAMETHPRNHALLRLLYASGARCAELCGLRWSDLKPREKAGQITVRGKGDKLRSILLSEATWNVLMKLRDSTQANDEGYVFVSRKGRNALTARQVERIVRASAKRAGLSANVSPHWLRHAHASNALERGAPLHLVQATLGHASVATTGVYLHARPGDSSSLYLAV